ncbi:MAG: acyltransferase [Bernardetiaceae bacterium]|jgi:peptidoglycan/LPS O-acetylase OafA/YrhL|nr:acyltransferase [Bernardetiaceae bacterium]
MKNPVSYLPNLTPLRGFAALFTVIFHLNLFTNGSLLDERHSLLLNKMYLMVDFFFALSGFILMHVYGAWFQDKVTAGTFKKFALARFARVYPLHLFTLLFLVGVRLWFVSTGTPDPDAFAKVGYRWEAVATNLLLIHSMNLHEFFTWNHASWSISTEWWMYMLFPFLAGPFVKLGTAGRWAVAAACWGGYWFIMYQVQPWVVFPEELQFIKAGTLGTINVGYDWGFLRCLFGFGLGCMVYLAYRDGVGRSILGHGLAFTLIALGMFASLHLALPDAVTAGFFPLLIWSAAYGSPAVDAFLGTRPLQRLGDWSFSIYLIHQPIAFSLMMVMTYLNPPQQAATAPPKLDPLTGWLVCLGYLALTLLLSYATYRLVEVPARKWLNGRFASRTLAGAR